MRGQIKVEFVFAMVVFSTIVFFIASQTNVLFTGILTDSRNDILKAKGIAVLDYLVTSPGDPPNWENLTTANRVGLAAPSLLPYTLSKAKVNALQTNCTNLDVFDLGGYRLTIYDDKSQILFCGFRSLESPTAVVIRYVSIEDIEGNVTLEMY